MLSSGWVFFRLIILFSKLLIVLFIHTHVASHRDSFARLLKGALVGLSKLSVLSRTVPLLTNLSEISSSVSLKLVPFCNTLFFPRKNVFTKGISRTYTQKFTNENNSLRESHPTQWSENHKTWHIQSKVCGKLLNAACFVFFDIYSRFIFIIDSLIIDESVTVAF